MKAQIFVVVLIAVVAARPQPGDNNELGCDRCEDANQGNSNRIGHTNGAAGQYPSPGPSQYSGQYPSQYPSPYPNQYPGQFSGYGPPMYGPYYGPPQPVIQGHGVGADGEVDWMKRVGGAFSGGLQTLGMGLAFDTKGGVTSEGKVGAKVGVHKY